jgi:hypothetical protein
MAWIFEYCEITSDHCLPFAPPHIAEAVGAIFSVSLQDKLGRSKSGVLYREGYGLMPPSILNYIMSLLTDA